MASVFSEVYINQLQENFYQGFANFMNFSVDHSSFVRNKKVHVPGANEIPNVVVDRSTFPASATRRTDVDMDYSIQSFTTDPNHIPDLDEFFSNYSVQESILRNHRNKQRETMEDNLIFKWQDGLPAGAILKTTGADSSNNLPHGTATGTRKKATAADFILAVQTLLEQNVPQEGIYAALPISMYFEILNDPDIKDASKFGNAVLPKGAFGELLGVPIFTRQRVGVFTSADAIKDVTDSGYTEATTDLAGGFLWQKDQVAKAEGELKVFDKTNDPEYYGDIYSTEKFHGGARLREQLDNKGVVSLVQAV